MKSARSWWLIFAACTVAVVAALVWITVVMVGLERAERQARADAEYQESLRLALWRMDSWFAPRLAREAARPPSDYATDGAWSAPGRSDVVRLHFQIEPDGRVSSPEISPRARSADEQTTAQARTVRDVDHAGLETIRRIAAQTDLAGRIAMAEVDFALLAAAGSSPEAPPPARPQSKKGGRGQDLAMRQRQYAMNINDAFARIDAPGSVGPLVPIWAGPAAGALVDEPDPATPDLVFARRVRRPEGDVVQGLLCDWPRLHAALVAEIADLFSTAVLIPVGAGADSAAMLATIPVELRGVEPPPAAIALISPATTTLAAMWLAVLTALVAVAITLRASIRFGEKRSRFASAVTHELRTPLTTFRMYSEMLAEGMVTSDEQRQTYLDTLKDEADRLGRLVENVLAYARLERGAGDVRCRELTMDQLIEHLTPPLRRQAERAGMTLDVMAEDSAARLSVDVDGMAQILGNLVENAGKYAADAENRSIEMAARVEGHRVVFRVRDHGPGVEARHARAIFAPFERGGRDTGDPTPGVGLGLALARGLARRLGGDVRLVPVEGAGACFELSVASRA